MAHRPLTIALRSLECLEETDEVGADEPYILVTACNLAGAIPQVQTLLYGPWGDVDQGETCTTLAIPANVAPEMFAVLSAFKIVRRPFWSLDNTSAGVISNPDNVIFMVSMMEHDDGKATSARTLVKAAATASLANSLSESRSTRVTKLRDDINGALGIPTGAPNFDDLVASRELELSTADVNLAKKGDKKKLSMNLKGDGGRYKAVFEIVAA